MLIQYLRCPIIGRGTEDDTYRPSIVDAIPRCDWQAFDERKIGNEPTGTMVVAIALPDQLRGNLNAILSAASAQAISQDEWLAVCHPFPPAAAPGAEVLEP